MSEIKFTSDGRKVKVLGSLNATEKIVQEIFIIDGSEIPSGEHFTAKSLHDAPAVSWKEKELKELEVRYASAKQILESDIKKAKEKSVIVKKKLESLYHLEQKIGAEQLTRLIDFISGNTKYVVTHALYGADMRIEEFDKFISPSEYDRDDLKLCSVFGRSKGDICFGINQYSDGSGSTRFLTPCNSHDEAVVELGKMFAARMEAEATDLTDVDIKIAATYGLTIPSEKIEKKKARELVAAERKISDLQDSLNKAIASRDKLI